MKKVKQFLLCNAKASLWLVYFVLVQSVVSIGIFFWLIYHDDEFTDRFIELFTPIVEMKDYIEQQKATYAALETLLTGVTTYILLISSAFLVISILAVLKLKKRTLIRKMEPGKVILYILIGTSINLILTVIVSILPKELVESHENATNLALSGTFFITLLSTGILAPITEELIFRYGVMKSFEKLNLKFALVYQAVAFGVLHGNLVQIIYATLLGLFFGYLYQKTDNLFITIVLHITINSSSVIISQIGCNDVLGLVGLDVILAAIVAFGRMRENKMKKRIAILQKNT